MSDSILSDLSSVEFVDLHNHSKYSRATSKLMDLEHQVFYAKKKGLTVLGTSDFTHPVWLKELKNKLVSEGNGFYAFKGLRFVLTTEISNIYSVPNPKNGIRVKKIHHVLVAPSFEVVDQINELLSKKGRLDYDGRPIFGGYTSEELVNDMMNISKDILIIPAHCLLPQENIITNKGLKKICEIKKGNRVLTHNGIYKQVTKVFKRKYSNNLVRIIPFYFREGVRTTPEHPIYAIKSFKKCKWTKGVCRKTCSKANLCKKKHYENYVKSWIPAKRLKVGDILVYPKIKGVIDKKELTIPRFKGNKKPIPEKVKVNKDFCRFMGYFLAEGSINNRDAFSFTFNIKEREYIEDVIKLTKKIFNISPKRKRIKNNQRGIELIYYSKRLVKLFRKIFYDLKGARAENKKLPQWAIKLPVKKQKQIFIGWWRGDKGYTVSEELANQMKIICLRMNLIPSIGIIDYSKYDKKIGKRKIKVNHKVYHFSNLSFFNDNLDLLELKEFKSFKTKRKTRHGWVDENYAYLPIRKVVYEKYKGVVLNLEVKDDNSYVTEFTTVHNCWTPWFALFGSNSGYDDIKECYGSALKHVHALETGLSSNPLMNWRLKQLDGFTLVSNSDSHSPYPWRLGRECNVIKRSGDVFSYKELKNAVVKRENFLFTVEVSPCFGKYHWTGHRRCGVVMHPLEAMRINNTCPKCHDALTVGVLQRVEELSDYEEGRKPESAIPFKELLPLHEVLRVFHGVSSVTAKKVQSTYEDILSHFGTEFNVLLSVPERELLKKCGSRLMKMLMLNREGKINYEPPGYDGVYGNPVFNVDKEGSEEQEKALSERKGQRTLTEF